VKAVVEVICQQLHDRLMMMMMMVMMMMIMMMVMMMMRTCMFQCKSRRSPFGYKKFNRRCRTGFAATSAAARLRLGKCATLNA